MKITETIKVRKDLADDFFITTETGIEVDNNKSYPAITVYTADSEYTAIFIDNGWHEVNNIDFE